MLWEGERGREREGGREGERERGRAVREQSRVHLYYVYIPLKYPSQDFQSLIQNSKLSVEKKHKKTPLVNSDSKENYSMTVHETFVPQN